MSVTVKMTQAQMDRAVVQGWKDAAIAAREPTMVAFYDRLLLAMERAAIRKPVVGGAESPDQVKP